MICSLVSKRHVLKYFTRYIVMSPRRLEIIRKKDIDKNLEISKSYYKWQNPIIDWMAYLEYWERAKYKTKEYLKVFTALSHVPVKDKPVFFQRTFLEDQIIYYFRSEDDLAHWEVIDDRLDRGRSWCEFKLSENNMTGTFRGYQSQILSRKLLPSISGQDQPNYYRGYCYITTKPFKHGDEREEFITVGQYDGFKIRFRGDGRMYQLQIHIELGMHMYEMYTFPIYTNGGPLWQEIKIPFSKLYSKKFDGMIFDQMYLPEYQVRYIRFLLNDGIDGPFQLELDYIAQYKNYNEKVFDKITAHSEPWMWLNKHTGDI